MENENAEQIAEQLAEQRRRDQLRAILDRHAAEVGKDVSGTVAWSRIGALATLLHPGISPGEQRKERAAIQAKLAQLIEMIENSNSITIEHIEQESNYIFSDLIRDVRAVLSDLAVYDADARAAGLLRGAPAKEFEALVSRVALDVFEDAFDRPATIITRTDSGTQGGPFVSFLGDIFAVLGIEASPVSQAKLAITFMEKRGYGKRL